MSCLNTRGIVLSQTAAFGTKKQDLLVTQTGIRYKRDSATKQPTSDIDGYNINVQSPRTGEIQTVKLPINVADTISKIKTALESEQLVTVTFNGTFKGKFWAMIGDNGRVNQGISATATDVEIVDIKDIQDDCFDDMIDM